MDVKTVGLNTKDTLLYFVNNIFVVMDDPEIDYRSPVVILRNHPGYPTEDEKREIKEGLKRIGMKLVGGSTFRKDGLWIHPVQNVRLEKMKEAKDGREISCSQENRQGSEGSI